MRWEEFRRNEVVTFIAHNRRQGGKSWGAKGESAKVLYDSATFDSIVYVEVIGRTHSYGEPIRSWCYKRNLQKLPAYDPNQEPEDDCI